MATTIYFALYESSTDIFVAYKGYKDYDKFLDSIIKEQQRNIKYQLDADQMSDDEIKEALDELESEIREGFKNYNNFQGSDISITIETVHLDED